MTRARTKKSIGSQMSVASEKPAERRKPVDSSLLLSTGATLLDLACSDSAFGGFAAGRMVNLIGDSSSGKTFIAMTMLAEAARCSQFKDYDLIFDDAESAMSFDQTKLFGAKAAKRIKEPPRGSSHTIEDFKHNMLDLIDEEKPFVYILDSFDSLTSEAELARAKKTQKGGEAGSYGMEKAKGASEMLRIITNGLKDTKSFLLIISQTRENISAMSFATKTRAGGKALKFYATHEIWTAVIRRLKKRERTIGVQVRAKVSKNKITGKERTVDFPLYYDYGVDDIGSCIDFLVEEKVWKKTSKTGLGKISAPGIENAGETIGTRQYLIGIVEGNHSEHKLKTLVADAWENIEDGLKMKRKGRYE